MNPYGLAASAFLAVAAAWLLRIGRRATAGYRGAMGWPVAAGVVVASRLEPAPVSPYGAARIRSYWPVVEYRYTAGGRELVGDRIFPADRLEAVFEREAAELIARFPEGAAVRVFHSPEDPVRSCLLPGQDFVGRRYALIAGTLAFAAALVAAVSV